MGGAKFCSFGNHHVRQAGFSLIEMAIVLVIITTVLTLGLGTLTTLFSSSNYAETRKRQERIKDALIAYVGANKRLPCPAKGNPDDNLATSDTSGAEERDAAGVCLAPFGIVPYTALGLGREIVEDGWQNFFSYQVTGSSSNCLPPTYNTTDINWANSNCFGAGKSGGLIVTLETPPSPASPVTTTGVVAVIISHGANGLGAWTRQGTQNASSPLKLPLCEEAHNAGVTSLSGCADTTNMMFYKGERDGNDDVVAYLTRDDIIQPLAKQGAILSASAKIQQDFDRLATEVIMQKMLSHPGSCTTTIGSFSPANRSDLLDNLDPWGSSYQYQIIEQPTDYFPICICTTKDIPATKVGSTLVKVSNNSIVVADFTTTPVACRTPNPTSHH